MKQIEFYRIDGQSKSQDVLDQLEQNGKETDKNHSTMHRLMIITGQIKALMSQKDKLLSVKPEHKINTCITIEEQNSSHHYGVGRSTSFNIDLSMLEYKDKLLPCYIEIHNNAITDLLYEYNLLLHDIN